MKSIKVKKNRLKTLKETLKIRNQVGEAFMQTQDSRRKRTPGFNDLPETSE